MNQQPMISQPVLVGSQPVFDNNVVMQARYTKVTQTTVQPIMVIQQTTLPTRARSRNSERIQCPHCNHEVDTTTIVQTGTGTWLAVGVICCVFWPCFCAPFFCGEFPQQF
eukprot:TRINITY_DN1093_c0_g1_i2.p1 TRINITY_DN1093_c0_g1~~TRINITY_DN1093_c0_g1_i2.p1  ORF type:complete len:110 (+),score=16.76 TRINITY_DN1093_c0_g1_i2:112-441(+)